MQGGGLEAQGPAKGAGVDHLNQDPGQAIAHRQRQQGGEQAKARPLQDEQTATAGGGETQALQGVELASARQPQHHEGRGDTDKGDPQDQQLEQFGHHKGLIKHLERGPVNGGSGHQVGGGVQDAQLLAKGIRLGTEQRQGLHLALLEGEQQLALVTAVVAIDAAYLHHPGPAWGVDSQPLAEAGGKVVGEGLAGQYLMCLCGPAARQQGIGLPDGRDQVHLHPLDSLAADVGLVGAAPG